MTDIIPGQITQLTHAAAPVLDAASLVQFGELGRPARTFVVTGKCPRRGEVEHTSTSYKRALASWNALLDQRYPVVTIIATETAAEAVSK